MSISKPATIAITPKTILLKPNMLPPSLDSKKLGETYLILKNESQILTRLYTER